MTKEAIETDPAWLDLIAYQEISRTRETARQSIFDVLSTHTKDVQELLPYHVAEDVCQDLHPVGFHTQRSVRIDWETNEEPQAGFIDVAAIDPESKFLATLQFDFDIPRRDHVEAINRSSPTPDLAIFVLTRPHLPSNKLATAVRDVTTDFAIIGLAENGKTLLTPAERDRLLEKRT